jgi:hypothetical protein
MQGRDLMAVTLEELRGDVTTAQAIFREHGAVVVQDAVGAHLLDQLEEAAARVRARVRSGDPFSCAGLGNEPDAILVSGTIHPQLGEPAFGEFLASPAMAAYASLLLEGAAPRFWFEGFWALEESREYDSGWHRDTSGILGTNHSEDVDEARELAILEASPERLGSAIKWQMSLLPQGDPCLVVCPGTHRRYRSAPERYGLVEDQMAPIDGAVELALRRGEMAFWLGTLVHRGRRPAHCTERLTLMGGLRRGPHGHFPSKRPPFSRIIMGGPYCDRKGQSEMIVVRASSRWPATALARCGADARQPGTRGARHGR